MNHEWTELIFLAQLAATLVMLGIIWFVQVVHYPLLSSVDESGFAWYAQRHQVLTSWVVAPTMLLEGITGALLLLVPPAGAPPWSLWLAASLLVVVWLSTAFVQVPCHQRLSAGFDAATHRSLVRTNWIRTACWTGRGVILIWITWTLFLDPNRPNTPEGTIKMAPLKVGDPAPDFTTTSQDGTQISIADYRGHRGVVLFFYPKDGTAICTKEACAFRDSYEKFAAAGVEVIGISSDTNESHQKFAQDHHLTFPLISDRDGSLRKLYRVPTSWGVLPGRVTYVIDQDGVIRLIFSAQLASDEHVQQALHALKHD